MDICNHLALLANKSNFLQFNVDIVYSVTIFSLSCHQVLILEPTQMYKASFYQPSYVTVNLEAEEQSLQLQNSCLAHLKGTCTQVHDWLFSWPPPLKVSRKSGIHVEQCLSKCGI